MRRLWSANPHATYLLHDAGTSTLFCSTASMFLSECRIWPTGPFNSARMQKNIQIVPWPVCTIIGLHFEPRLPRKAQHSIKYLTGHYTRCFLHSFNCTSQECVGKPAYLQEKWPTVKVNNRLCKNLAHIKELPYFLVYKTQGFLQKHSYKSQCISYNGVSYTLEATTKLR